jgi:micrococcal nuclease
VRLLGIDAPELGSAFETPAPFAREARERLVSFAHQQWVRLEGDDEKRDSYGRALAYVFRTDGRMLNVEMLRAGLARISARRSLRRFGELRRAEQEAQRARRGIWGERPSIADRSFRIPR